MLPTPRTVKSNVDKWRFSWVEVRVSVSMIFLRASPLQRDSIMFSIDSRGFYTIRMKQLMRKTHAHKIDCQSRDECRHHVAFSFLASLNNKIFFKVWKVKVTSIMFSIDFHGFYTIRMKQLMRKTYAHKIGCQSRDECRHRVAFSFLASLNNKNFFKVWKVKVS